MQNTTETLEFFQSQFGTVEENVFSEIVFDDPAIFTHQIKPSAASPCVTLFTTGMSGQTLPRSSSEKASGECAFAELFIQLPADWELDMHAMGELDNRWPLDWLRTCARAPFHANQSLAFPVAVFANDSPTETLSPNNKFCGVMLFAHLRHRGVDNTWVYLYRMLPLYWEEIQLINQKDVGALLNEFDSQSIGFVVDIHRKNVGVR